MTSIALKNSKFMEGFNKVAEGGTKVAQNIKESVKDGSLLATTGMAKMVLGAAMTIGGGFTGNGALALSGVAVMSSAAVNLGIASMKAEKSH